MLKIKVLRHLIQRYQTGNVKGPRTQCSMQRIRSGMEASSVIFLIGSSAPPSSLFYSLFSRWPFP